MGTQRRGKHPGAPGSFGMIPTELYDAMRPGHPARLSCEEWALFLFVLSRGPRKIDSAVNYGQVHGDRTAPYSVIKGAFGWSDKVIKARLDRLVELRYLDKTPGYRKTTGTLSPTTYRIGPRHPWVKGFVDPLPRREANPLPRREATGTKGGDGPLPRREVGDKWYNRTNCQRNRPAEADSPIPANLLPPREADLESTIQGEALPGPESENCPIRPNPGSIVTVAPTASPSRPLPIGVNPGKPVTTDGGWWVPYPIPQGGKVGTNWAGPYGTKKDATAAIEHAQQATPDDGG
jgi:hypothetical protein